MARKCINCGIEEKYSFMSPICYYSNNVDRGHVFVEVSYSLGDSDER